MALWDLTALVNAADAKAGLAERHLWLVRLMEWLRHTPPGSAAAAESAAADLAEPARDTPRTPLPVVRLRHLINVIEKNPALHRQVRAVLSAFWRDIDAAALFADFGFGGRVSLLGDVATRIRKRLLPATPETTDLAQLFQLLFKPGDEQWMAAIDAPLRARVAALLDAPEARWRQRLLSAITILTSAVHASGYAPALRQRMDRELLANEPFRQLTQCSEALRSALTDGSHEEALRQARLLRTVLDACRRAAASVPAHLEAFGVSVDIVYELDQLDARAHRIEILLDCLLSPEPQVEMHKLVGELVQVSARQRGVRTVLARHYSLLARQVAERSAETGSHYITRDRAGYVDMLRKAAGGGSLIAGTIFTKAAIGALGLSAFWLGFWSGINYATCFVIVMLLHWTVATKQPAMTAPALAESLSQGDINDDATLNDFVERVVQLVRSQAAGIIGNLAACAPLVLLVQWASQAALGEPLVSAHSAEYVLGSLTLLGPTALFAAFTGVLLFASSLIAGWAENWFVFHRLDSAIAWNPVIVSKLGAGRALRWATWWRNNISGLAANVSLGMMLGMVPVLLQFFGIPLDVRHVTLSTGQVASALGALGLEALRRPEFWWCVASIPVIGALNLGVSFFLAFRVALRSRGIAVRERSRIYAALRARAWRDPLSLLLPPR